MGARMTGVAGTGTQVCGGGGCPLANRGYSSSLASSANSGSRSRKLGEKRKKILEEQGEEKYEEQISNSFLLATVPRRLKML
jgi:hypothetical protein